MTQGAPRLAPAASLSAMLEAKSVAIVGASDRPGSFGRRVIDEIAKSRSDPVVHLVNPRYQHIDGRKCCASLDQIDGPVDLVLMCVPDSALESALQMAAARRDHSAVIFGSAWEAPADREAGEPGEPGSAGEPSLRERIKRIAAQSQMSVCGAGCMG
ncbi:MAG: CoA-binding protein, partial [Acidimicrobiales bacterium]